MARAGGVIGIENWGGTADDFLGVMKMFKSNCGDSFHHFLM